MIAIVSTVSRSWRQTPIRTGFVLAVLALALASSGCGGSGGSNTGGGNSSGNTPSAPYQLSFQQQPSNVALGSSFTTVIVLEHDGAVDTSGPYTGDTIQLRVLDSTGSVVSTAGSASLVSGALTVTVTPPITGTFTIVAADGSTPSVQQATSQPFSVTTPQPTITALAPAQIMLGSDIGIMSAVGKNLPPAATVVVDGSTVIGSSTSPGLLISFTPPASAINTVGQHTVMISDWGPFTFSVYAPAQFTPPLAAPPEYPATDANLFVGDVDGDGKPDVILNSMQWLPGLGNGQLGAMKALSLDSLPSGVAASQALIVATGHIGSSDATDLVAWTRQGCPSGESGLFALLNDGAGNYNSGPLACVGGQYVNRVYVADLNGGGTPFLVVEIKTPAGSDEITTMAVAADGTLGAPSVLATDDANNSLAVGGFTNDGRLDLAYESLSAQGIAQQIKLLLNTGAGNFQSESPAQLAGVTGSFVLADLNHDGNLDILAQPQPFSTSSEVEFFAGNGDGTFQSPVSTSLGSGSATISALAVGDFDGDGNLDAVGIDGASMVYLWGRGDGTFQTQILPADQSSAPSIGDLNGDGIPDIVTANAGGVTVSLGAKGSRPSSGAYINGATVAGAAAPLAPGQLPSMLSGKNLLVNNGDGTFTSIAAPVGASLLADVDGDGKADALGVDTQGDLLIWPGQGGGQFGSPITIATNDTCAGCDGLQVADLDGSGHLDIIGDGFILYNEGGMNFQLASIPQNYGLAPLLVGDFAGNGHPDIVIVGLGKELINLGGGQFQTINSQITEEPPGSVAVGDFNGDGRDDVAVSQSNGNVWVYEGQPDGSLLFTSLLICEGDTNPGPLAAIPNPGGGAMLVAGSGDDAVTLFSAQANGEFTRAYVAVGLVPQSFTVADFNGDGHLDLATGGGGGVSIVWGH